jgi:hypothetical protein
MHACTDYYSIIQALFDFLEGLPTPIFNAADCAEITATEGDKIVVTNYTKIKHTYKSEILQRLAHFVHVINPDESYFTKIIHRIAISLCGLKQPENECFMGRVMISPNVKNQIIVRNFYALFSYQINTIISDNGIKTLSPNPKSHLQQKKEDILLDECEEFIKMNTIDDEKTRIMKDKFKQLIQEISSIKS